MDVIKTTGVELVPPVLTGLRVVVIGTHAERTGTTWDCAAGSLFIESDTGDWFMFDGTAWFEV